MASGKFYIRAVLIAVVLAVVMTVGEGRPHDHGQGVGLEVEHGVSGLTFLGTQTTLIILGVLVLIVLAGALFWYCCVRVQNKMHADSLIYEPGPIRLH